jgi:hypothetical protein
MTRAVGALALLALVGCGPARIVSSHDASPADGRADAGGFVDGGPADGHPAEDALAADAPLVDDGGPADSIPPQQDSGPPPHCGDGTAEGEARCAIDLATVVYHESVDVSGWPVTKTITSVQLSPSSGEGVKLTMAPYNPLRDADSWPDFIMWPPDGHLRWTLWLFVRFGGQWHGAAVLEFWCDREWSGAPLLTNYVDWIYPNPGSPWGEMGDYVPVEGDTVGFMATAGDLRRHKDYLTVNERTNVVTVLLVPTALYTF